MDPITIMAIAGLVSAVAPVVGDLIGRALGSGDHQKAMQLAQQAVDQFNIQPPDIQALTAHLQSTAMSGVRADPNAVALQQSNMTALSRIANQGPDNIEFRAQMDAANRAANQQAAGQNEALRNEMQARGRGGTGAEFAVRALENQQAAERASEGGFRAAQSADQRALSVLASGAGLASDIRRQSFGEQSDIARASDALAQFNEAGRVSGAQQQFANQMGLAGARAGAMNRQAGILQGEADKTQQQFGNYGQAVGQGAAVLGDYFAGQRKREPQAGRYGAGGYG